MEHAHFISRLMPWTQRSRSYCLKLMLKAGGRPAMLNRYIRPYESIGLNWIESTWINQPIPPHTVTQWHSKPMFLGMQSLGLNGGLCWRTWQVTLPGSRRDMCSPLPAVTMTLCAEMCWCLFLRTPGSGLGLLSHVASCKITLIWYIDIFIQNFTIVLVLLYRGRNSSSLVAARNLSVMSLMSHESRVIKSQESPFAPARRQQSTVICFHVKSMVCSVQFAVCCLQDQAPHCVQGDILDRISPEARLSCLTHWLMSHDLVI